MNRRLTLLTPLLVSLILIAFAPPAHADTEIEPTIVVDYTVDPATLMPGDTGTVAIILTNGATDALRYHPLASYCYLQSYHFNSKVILTN